MQPAVYLQSIRVAACSREEHCLADPVDNPQPHFREEVIFKLFLHSTKIFTKTQSTSLRSTREAFLPGGETHSYKGQGEETTSYEDTCPRQ